MQVHFTPEQEARLHQLGADKGTAAEELVREAALQLIDVDPLLLASVRRGIAQADAGELLDHDEVMARVNRSLQSR